MSAGRARALAALALIGTGALGGCRGDDAGQADAAPRATRTETEAALTAQRDVIRTTVEGLAAPLLPESTVEDAAGRWTGCTEDRDATSWPERSGFADLSYAASATLLTPVDPATAQTRGERLLEGAGFTVERVVPGPPSVQVFGVQGDVQASVALFTESDRVTVAARGTCVPLPEQMREEWSVKADEEARIPLR